MSPENDVLQRTYFSQVKAWQLFCVCTKACAAIAYIMDDLSYNQLMIACLVMIRHQAITR